MVVVNRSVFSEYTSIAVMGHYGFSGRLSTSVLRHYGFSEYVSISMMGYSDFLGCVRIPMATYPGFAGREHRSLVIHSVFKWWGLQGLGVMICGFLVDVIQNSGHKTLLMKHLRDPEMARARDLTSSSTPESLS